MSTKQNDTFNEQQKELQDEIQEETSSMEEKLEVLETLKKWKVEKTDGRDDAYREHQYT